MKYTEGEWKAISDDGSLMVIAPRKTIAVISHNNESEANANLIAAAPDLYEALKALMKEYWLSTEPAEDATTNWRRAQDALNKAEGK